MFQLTHAQALAPGAWTERQPLLDVAATRTVEQALQHSLPPHTLMQRAGLAVARLAMAIAPHARRIWVACGPGNNGGDGVEAALWLRRWGKQPVVTRVGDAAHLPPDAAAAWQRALEAGIVPSNEEPGLEPSDLVIDALLGIGARHPLPQALHRCLDAIAKTRAQVLCVDVPTALDANTGQALGADVAWWRNQPAARRHTLSLLSLKPGLFTAQGRDAAGAIWFDGLATPKPPTSPCAWLNSAPAAAPRRHASHKGSHGDVVVVGGAPGMMGAAVLAATAALHAGAGRVWWQAVQPIEHMPVLAGLPPDIMVRDARQGFSVAGTGAAVVCGCGGGEPIAPWLAPLLATQHSLVLDADALNAIAAHPELRQALGHRHARGLQAAVLTPHPLEAARLLSVSPAEVQANRLAAAQQLADLFRCCVVLKGSGTVIAAPGQLPVVNPTGNARLAIAGTGDVLAGLLGARLAQAIAAPGETGNPAGTPAPLHAVQTAACTAVWEHGAVAERADPHTTLTASALARLLQTGG